MKKLTRIFLSAAVATSTILFFIHQAGALTCDPADCQDPLTGWTKLSYDDTIWQQADPDNNGFDGDNILKAEIYVKGIDAATGTFTMLVRNTTDLTDPNIGPYDFPATVSLTGIGFNLGGYDLGGGSVEGYMNGNWTDVSNTWVYHNDPIIHGPFDEQTNLSVDTTVSTLQATLPNGGIIFGDGSGYNPNYGVDGPKDGILPEGIDMDNFLSYFACITLSIGNTFDGNWNSLFDYIDSQDIVVAFGSPDMAPVPEPATVLLFGAGLVGLAGLGRKRIRK